MSTSVTTGDRRPTSPRKQPRRLLIPTVIIGLIVLVVAGITLMQGHVVGQEFSPTHFQSRRFEYYELPGLRWQLTPIERKPATQKPLLFLVQKSFIHIPPGNPDRWDLIELTRGINRATDDASLLIDILQIPQSQTTRWQQWSIDHPKMAQELWPIVQTLAIRELYILIPRVFEIVESHHSASAPKAGDAKRSSAGDDDPVLLRQRLSRHLDQQYQVLINDLRQSGLVIAADRLANEYAAAPLVPIPEDVQ